KGVELNSTIFIIIQVIINIALTLFIIYIQYIQSYLLQLLFKILLLIFFREGFKSIKVLCSFKRKTYKNWKQKESFFG
ncbi:MAG: hypothetical protein KKA35_15695, partial [Proteobacteria bacterium]|nr:hypothetical protein [Pseudomonadota bacterium]